MVLLILAALPMPRSATAQEQPEVEYGSAADLAGVERIFIDTGDDMEDHDNIAKIIAKKLPDLAVTSRAQDAEVILVYRSSEATYYAGTIASGSSETNAEIHANSARSIGGSSQTTSDGYSAALYQTISRAAERCSGIPRMGECG
jgi:hypothetical protein